MAKSGGPFGVPSGSVKFENPDGVGMAYQDGTVTHNVYDGTGPLPQLIPGDYDNTRAITPGTPDTFKGS